MEEDEGVPIVLSEDESHESFVIALKGMKWDPNAMEWQPLEQGSDLEIRIEKPGNSILFRRMNLVQRAILLIRGVVERSMW